MSRPYDLGDYPAGVDPWTDAHFDLPSGRVRQREDVMTEKERAAFDAMRTALRRFVEEVDPRTISLELNELASAALALADATPAAGGTEE